MYLSYASMCLSGLSWGQRTPENVFGNSQSTRLMEEEPKLPWRMTLASPGGNTVPITVTLYHASIHQTFGKHIS